MKIVTYHSNLLLKSVLMISLIALNSCVSNRVGGTIPVFMDQYVETTDERRFKVTEEIEGYIIKYQKAYDCNHEFYKYNATAIISSESKFLTIYDYCQQTEFKKGDKIIIKPPEIINEDYSIREILEPFPRSSDKYGYWQCISCQYTNAFGSIELKNEE